MEISPSPLLDPTTLRRGKCQILITAYTASFSFGKSSAVIFMALVIETMIRVRHLHNYLYVKKYLELI